MKSIAIVILAVTVIALGTWCVNQQNRIKSQSAQLVQTQAQFAALKAESEKQSDVIEHAKFATANEQILQQALVQTEAGAAKKTEQFEQSLAAAKTNNPLQVYAAIYKDPKMREALKAQQKTSLGPFLDKQYGTLFQQLNLTPDQTGTLKDLMEKKMLVDMDSGYQLLDSSLTASQRADLAKQIKDQTDDIENQIKQFLGNEKYQAFQSYQKTFSDRMTVNQLSDQLSGTANSLTPDQQQQLFQTMSDVRANFKWTAVLHNNRDPANGDYASVYTEDNINQFMQEREQYDQQILARAQQILTPDQLAAFQDHQRVQRQLEMASIKMIAQMFTPKGQ